MDDTESKSVLGMRTPVLVVVTSLALGGIAFLVSYINARFARQHKNLTSNKNVSERQENDEENIDDVANSLHDDGKNAQLTSSNGNATANTTSGKRAKNKKRREAQQEFTHSWMVGALKGHTGPVLDMNFSSNGKFLATCAEDCDLVLEEEPELGDASSGEGEYMLPASTRCKVIEGMSEASSSSAGSSSSSSSSPSPSSTVNSSPSSVKSSKVRVEVTSSTKDRSEWSSLSRRQRKNRTRTPREQQRRDRDDDNDNDEENSSIIIHRHSSAIVSGSSSSSSRHRHHHRLLQHHNELGSRHFTEKSPSRDSTDSSSLKPPSNRRGVSSHQQSANSKALSSAINSNNVPKVSSSAKNSQTSGKNATGNGVNSTTSSSSSGNSSSSSKKSKNSSTHHHHHHHRVSSQRDELNHLSDAALASLLRRYTLTGMQLAHLGYPVECSYFPGYAVILNHQQHPMGHRTREQHHHLDANAREFVPGNNNNNNKNNNSSNSSSGNSATNTTSWRTVECDSGNGSGSSLENSDLEPECSSDSDKSSDIGECSSSSSSSSSCSSSSSYAEKSRSRSRTESWNATTESNSHAAVERSCVRCHKSFYVNRKDGKYIIEDKCLYHWGKLRNGNDRRQRDKWECCQGQEDSEGCTNARTHVWTGVSAGYNGPLSGYVRTRPSRVLARDGNYGAYALDCEMCFTRRGLELAKVTLVGMDGRIVYDNLVKPCDEVIDHNTRFSGITANDLAKATKNLQDVQKDITSFVHAETILIGHGLENDLRALKLLHTTVIDTCVAFPHFLGYPFRSSLKTLARTVLKRDIQVTEHDSVEDARIAADLMLRRLQHDLY